jgi:hypothetical protein
LKQVAIYSSNVKGSFEVLAKGRQGYREKRKPFVFNPMCDIVYVTHGASATPHGQFFGHGFPEQH